MRRREFIKVIAGSGVAWPLVARAQQRAMPVVGYLGSETPEKFGIRVTAFQQGLLKELQPDISMAWIEQNIPYTPGPMAKFLEGMRKAGLQ